MKILKFEQFINEATVEKGDIYQTKDGHIKVTNQVSFDQFIVCNCDEKGNIDKKDISASGMSKKTLEKMHKVNKD
jgi:hypothetical protein